MNGVKSIESVLFLELIRTLKLGLNSLKVDEFGKNIWQKQLAYFKKLVRFYMLDLDIKEFKDLRLPSEQKGKIKVKGSQDRKQPKKPRIRTSGKQLQLFFIRYAKHTALTLVIVIERVMQSMESALFKDSKEFDNKIRV